MDQHHVFRLEINWFFFLSFKNRIHISPLPKDSEMGCPRWPYLWFLKKLWRFKPHCGARKLRKNWRSESWRLICIMFSGLSCRCVFLPWNSMDVLLSKTGNTSPKWDVSTKKMGGSPECASSYAQKCPTKSKPYLRMMCARDQHLNSHKDFRFF